MAIASLQGSKKLEKKFGNLIDVIDEREMEKELLKPARKLKNIIKTAAPRGPTGNLARGVVAKKFRYKIKGSPAVFVAMDYRIAPHFHLVEFGTRYMPARPFFRPSVDREGDRIVNDIEDVAWKLIEKETKKR